MQRIQIMRIVRGYNESKIEYVIESSQNPKNHFACVGYADNYEEALTIVGEIIDLNKDDFQPVTDGCLNKEGE